MKNKITSPEERVMPRKNVFLVSGGAGRIICALPAFEKYLKIHGEYDFYIVSQSGLEFFLGTEFQDIAFDPTHKGLFKDIIKPNNLINLEPYQEYGYYNQEKSLTESFDKLINGCDTHGDLERPKIVLSKSEEINAINIIKEAEKQQGKEKTVVIQPFGRNAIQHDGGHVVDETSRSLSTDDYFYISEHIRKKYNVISMTEIKFENDDNLYVDTNLRHWSGIIEAADYFIGVDSCGQHMAYAFDKPGSVILGSTFAKNISYPDHFNIVEKPSNLLMDQYGSLIHKHYSPIRIEGLDSELANRKNDTCMDFSKEELEDITNNIMGDIRQKCGGAKGRKKPSEREKPVNLNNLLGTEKDLPYKLAQEIKNQGTKSKSKKGFNQVIDLKPKDAKPMPASPKGGCATDGLIEQIKKSCAKNVLSKKSKS